MGLFSQTGAFLQRLIDEPHRFWKMAAPGMDYAERMQCIEAFGIGRENPGIRLLGL